jgi:hypothetical protein
MPQGIMPDSARQEGSATTYGPINNSEELARPEAWVDPKGQKQLRLYNTNPSVQVDHNPQ